MSALPHSHRDGENLYVTNIHPELPGVASLHKLQTNPRIHGCDIVSRTNTIDTIELLYSYLAASPTQMHNGLYCVDL
jgi:hypothetical protein